MKKINIQYLPREFIGVGEVKGFKFKRMLFTDNIYVYEVIQEDINRYFEVFKRESSPIAIDFKNRIYSETEFKEVYPKANKFGVTAWSVKSPEEALEKIEELEKKINDI